MSGLDFEVFQPVRLFFGVGQRNRLGELLEGRRTLLVTGSQTLERGQCLHLLSSQVMRSSPVPPNPGDAVIDRLLSQARRHQAECVLGLGGGSVMDAAKVVAMLHENCSTMDEYRRRGQSVKRRTGLIQVPTTAGTGSEVTRWASLWNDGVKSSVDEVSGFADLAVVDPEFCQGSHPRLALACGLDALSHAMESLWGVRSNPISESYAGRALSLISQHLPLACAGRAEPSDWETLALASTLAGLALSCTRSAAAHALSYQMTGQFGLEHGLAVGLLCRSLLLWNQEAAADGIARILGALGVDTVEEAQSFIDRCFQSAGLEPRLSAFNIFPRDFERILEQALGSNRLGNNPGNLTPDDLRRILHDIA